MLESRRTRLLLYALFFASGMAGLVYQIVWTRLLVLVFGNTLLATSTVLSAFMGGLAAGSYVLGRHVDRHPRGLIRLYALLEAGIGGFALVFPFLLAAATPVYSLLYRTLEGDVALLNLVRFSVCFALISVPTFLMGGTLPVLLKRFAGGRGRVGAQTGFLYGLNTAGAVAGTIACGYVLLRVLGMQHTTWVAVALNLGVAAVAWTVGRRETAVPPESENAVERAAAPKASPVYRRATANLVLLGVGISGFSALAYEVFWTRMLNLFLHNTVYSFTAILATFLVGIAVGSLVYSRFLARVPDQVPLFVGLQVAIGLLAYATPFVFSLLLDPLFRDFSSALTLAKTSVIMLPPTLLMGIAVPMAVEIWQRGTDREGTSVGTVYAVNTVGAILGAFAAGFVLLPGLGLQRGVVLVASLNVVAGALPGLSRGGRRRPIWATTAAGLLIALALLAPPDLFRGLFERSHPSAELLHYKEGKVANVVVYDFQKTGYKDLHLNAVEEASSRLWHVQLFKILGLLPPLLHEEPTDALMVAFGAGMSAGACAQQVDELRCVDLNPDIEGVAEVFIRENLDVIHNPRFTKVVNDGRNALLLDPRKYSLIISDATNPKMFDSWTLYSREFYELARDRLEPGGIFAQWVLIPLPGDSIQVILNTFRSVYPHTSVWCVYGSSQCVMLGTPERLEIDYGELEERLTPILDSSGLAEFGIDGVEKLLSFFFLGEDQLGELLGGFSKLSTDDLPYAQFHVEQDRAGIEASLDLVRHQESILPYLRNTESAPDDLERTLATYQEISRRLHLGFLTGDTRRYREALAITRRTGLDDANVRSALHYGPEKKRYFEARVARHPDDANAHNTLGFIYWHEGDLERAETELGAALDLAPDFAAAHANLARLYVDMGELDRATAKLLELRRLHPTKQTLETTARYLEMVRLKRKLRFQPGSASLHRALATKYHEDGRIVRAIDELRAAAELAPTDPATVGDLARVLETHELVVEAREAYERLAKLVPGDPGPRTKSLELASLEIDDVRRRAWLAARTTAPPEDSGLSNHPETCDLALAAWHDFEFEGRVHRADLARAAALYEESIAAAPGDLHAYVDAALLYEILGDRGRAAGLWRNAGQVRPEWQTPAIQVERLELLDRLESGQVAAEEEPRVRSQIARHFRALGRTEEGISYLEAALEIDPERAATWESLAEAMAEAGLYRHALRAAERALQLDSHRLRAAQIESALSTLPGLAPEGSAAP